MGRYVPGTLDDAAVMRRRRAATRSSLGGAGAPGGSQVFQTTEKVREMQSALIPVGGTVHMASDVSPAESGYPGAWRRLTAWHVPMTGVTLYIYEREE